MLSTATTSIRQAFQALRWWRARQFITAAIAATLIAGLIGVATVLIPNGLFARDIPPVWWNYPVWIATSILSGMLFATYVKAPDDQPEDPKSSRLGLIGTILAWFAVGCPVCNKIALLALGYAGAITWFAPFQPFLAAAALILTGVALVWRLKGQVACSVTYTNEAQPA